MEGNVNFWRQYAMANAIRGKGHIALAAAKAYSIDHGKAVVLWDNGRTTTFHSGRLQAA